MEGGSEAVDAIHVSDEARCHRHDASRLIPEPRATYRHGDLQQALLDAAVELARSGGPTAVALREVTRQAGVVPNAAYRHYGSRDDLLDAVRRVALAACASAMRKELAKVKGHGRIDTARLRLRAVGAGYLRFARAEPGLFRTAFSAVGPLDKGPALDETAAGRHPFTVLGAVLDELVEAGALSAASRPGAEYVAWSAVHGLALLALEGPLVSFGRAQLRSLAARVLDMVENGLR